jgi:hypothetical protein
MVEVTDILGRTLMNIYQTTQHKIAEYGIIDYFVPTTTKCQSGVTKVGVVI